MSMKQLKATERQIASIYNICRERGLPTKGAESIPHLFQINEQLRDKNPDGYDGARTFLNKCFEYIRTTKS